jgi:hypothetical protein
MCIHGYNVGGLVGGECGSVCGSVCGDMWMRGAVWGYIVLTGTTRKCGVVLPRSIPSDQGWFFCLHLAVFVFIAIPHRTIKNGNAGKVGNWYPAHWEEPSSKTFSQGEGGTRKQAKVWLILPCPWSRIPWKTSS